MATLKDVAKRAEVSPSTVAAILNDRPHCYASAATRERVRRAAAEVGYRPNRLARALVQGRSRLLGLLTVNAQPLPFGRAVDGVEDAAVDAGYGLLLCHSHTRPERERQHLQLFADIAVDGIVAVSPSSVGQTDEVLAYRPDGVPLVSINREIAAPGVRSILMRNFEAARAMTEHLIAQGHRRIVYLDAPVRPAWMPLPMRSSVDRSDGYRSAMEAAGLEASVVPLPPADTHERVAVAKARTESLLGSTEPPTALFGASDYEAVGALHACVTTGRRVPEDVALAGFADLDIGRWAVVPISSVRRPFYEAGRLAVEYLVAWEAGSDLETLYLDCQMCLRESTGAATAPADQAAAEPLYV